MNMLRQLPVNGKGQLFSPFTGSKGKNQTQLRKGVQQTTSKKTPPTVWLSFNGANLGIALRIASRRPSTKRRTSIGASLGFTADPRIRIERAANGLLKDAAMLLLYQEVFRSPPAQAFLKVLLGLRRGDDGLKLLESYGEFFKLMAIGRYPSWEDYILEGILSGEKNPFAEASADVGNPKLALSGGVPPSLRAAAAADLDSLQRLAITESTLSGWVAEIVADVRPEWRTATASNLSCKSVSTAPSPSEEGTKVFGFNISEPKSEDREDFSDSNHENPTNNFVSSSEESDGSDSNGTAGGWRKSSIRTFVHEDREMWRKKIGGLWRWSEAVPLLEKYYSDHSVGRVSSTQFLQWKGGKITIDQIWATQKIPSWDLSTQRGHKEALLKNLTRHAERKKAQHVLLYGQSGTGKSWLLRSVLSQLTRSRDLHIVTIQAAEIKSICTVLEELARHWQLRFALVVDDLTFGGREDNCTYLKSALQHWPHNVLLCATSLVDVPKEGKDGGEVRHRDLAHFFGLTLRFDDLDVDEFLRCVRELMENRKGGQSCDLGGLPESVAAEAEMWGKKLDIWSVRSAAQFVDTNDVLS